MTDHRAPTPGELAELDQLRAGAEAELDDRIRLVRELFAAADEVTASHFLAQLVARLPEAVVRGGFILCLMRLAKERS